jgi:hypothetical protein
MIKRHLKNDRKGLDEIKQMYSQFTNKCEKMIIKRISNHTLSKADILPKSNYNPDDNRSSCQKYTKYSF